MAHRGKKEKEEEEEENHWIMVVHLDRLAPYQGAARDEQP
jgi:hypothetical protein